MKLLASILSLAITFATVSLSAAPIYLKADATGAGDGSSWANAYTTVADAIAALNASEDAQPTLYIAGGVYQVTAAQTLTVANAVIQGGYRASEDGDEIRDVKEYQTVFSHMTEASLKSLTIKHRVPEDGSLTVNTSETRALFANGKFNFPEEQGWYTGTHDVFSQNGYNGTANLIPLTIAAGAGGLVSGINFVGGNRQPHLSVVAGAAATTVEDCGFYFSYAQGSTVTASAPTTFRRCSFRFHDIPYGGGVLSAGAGCLVEDCLFSDMTPARYYGQQLVNLVGAVMRNCVFRRNHILYTDSTNCNPNNGGVLRAASGAIVENTVFSNNYSTIFGTYNLPPVEADQAHFLQCLFKDNLMRVNPCKDLVYAFVQSAYAAYHNSLDGCTFVGNKIEGLATPTGDFGMAMVANSKDGSKLAVVNCSFVSNEVGAVDLGAVTASFSRGILTYAASASKSTSQLGVANCTFLGPYVEGVGDIVQVGASHGQPLTVVNSIFQTDSIVPVNPFVLAVPALAVIRNCTIKNMLEIYHPQDFDLSAGLGTDEIPHVADGAIWRPAAKTPDIRLSADVGFTDATAVPRCYQYRVPDGGWQPLVSTMKATTVAEPEPVSDAAGETRIWGSFTRGAVQRLSDVAENGKTLTVRTEPLTSGTVSSPSTQAVATDAAVEPVTATPVEGLSFAGWFGEDGKVYQSGATLEISGLSSNLVLTAKFSSRQVTIVFDLDGKGRFVENGESTLSVQASAGSVFPPVPDFVLDAGWLCRSKATPAAVEDTDEPIVIRPEILTTDVRAAYVTPTGAGKRDGSSWENAYGSIVKAYEDVAFCRGEVRLQEGVYLVDEAMALRSHVKFVGGYPAAGEGLADARLHPTILTGDKTSNNSWATNSVPSGVKICENGKVNYPPVDSGDVLWKHSIEAGDVPSAFQNLAEGGVVSNVVFEGVVFCGFSTAAVKIATDSEVAFMNCDFVGNGVYGTANHGGVVSAGTVHAENCRFSGGFGQLILTGNGAGTTNTVVGCMFDNNWGSVYGVSIYVDSGSKPLTVSGSKFSCNRITDNLYWCRSAAAISLKGSGAYVVEDCEFVRNRVSGDAIATVLADYAGCSLSVRRCRFHDNSFDSASVRSASYNCGAMPGTPCLMTMAQFGTTVADCLFDNNTLRIAAGEAATYPYASAIGLSGDPGRVNVINSTFVGNVATDGADTPMNHIGTIAVGISNPSASTGTGFAIVNCAFNGNICAGATAADVNVYGHVESTASRCETVTLLNSILWNDADDYLPIGFYGQACRVQLHSCAMKNFDKCVFAEPDAYSFVRRTSADDPLLSETLVEAPDGRPSQLRVGARSVFARKGLPVHQVGDKLYYYDAEGFPKYPWRVAADRTAVASAVEGLDVDSPLLPDAWGCPREKKHVASGPLNAEPLGLILMVW